MNIKKKQEGFTIIEVMIVLAIAGLIMVVALIAIPQLQRNQRNNARQAVLSRMSTEIGNFAGNNNGRLPDASDSTEMFDFYSRYLGNVNTEDPRTGSPIPILSRAFTSGDVPQLTDSAATVTTTPTDHDGDPATPDIDVPTGNSGGDLGVAYYSTDAACDGETVTTGAGNRSYVLVTVLEGGAVYCLDNS